MLHSLLFGADSDLTYDICRDVFVRMDSLPKRKRFVVHLLRPYFGVSNWAYRWDLRLRARYADRRLRKIQ